MVKKEFALAMIIIVLCFASFQPSQKTFAENRNLTILENQTNIREGPGLNYGKIGQVQKGDTFQILSEKDDWMQIELKNGKKGWVANWLISVQQDFSTSTAFKKGMNVSVNTNGLRVRTGPSTNYGVVGTLIKGESATVTEINGDWVKIDSSTLDGWVSNDFLLVQKETKPESKSGTITATTLNVRSESSLNGKVVATVYKGDSFAILDEENNWTKIEYKKGVYGWVASWFLEKSATAPTTSGNKETDIEIEILYNGTNLRKKPTVQSEVVQRANEGDTFSVSKLENDWYEVRLENGNTAFVAGWLVSTNGIGLQVDKPGAEIHLKNKTIVIDPGHGGRDNGTTGTRGTLEKELTIQTATLLSNKLKAAGANVILTRTYDSYISLDSRVRSAHYHGADAFISLHYDSINDRSVKGTSTFYYHSYQKPLASTLHSSVVQYTNLKDRGVRLGNYHVIRENKQKAVLIELGYLSNPTEEAYVSTAQYQEKAATGIYQGLARYFKN
jgi:N-acetylmuramoyl-L-alanine amidase